MTEVPLHTHTVETTLHMSGAVCSGCPKKATKRRPNGHRHGTPGENAYWAKVGHVHADARAARAPELTLRCERHVATQASPLPNEPSKPEPEIKRRPVCNIAACPPTSADQPHHCRENDHDIAMHRVIAKTWQETREVLRARNGANACEGWRWRGATDHFARGAPELPPHASDPRAVQVVEPAQDRHERPPPPCSTAVCTERDERSQATSAMAMAPVCPKRC